MTWNYFADSWPELLPLFKDYFPHAQPPKKPSGVMEMFDLLCDLSDSSDLTLNETAELLDDMLMTAWSHGRYVNDVTQRMVASS